MRVTLRTWSSPAAGAPRPPVMRLRQGKVSVRPEAGSVSIGLACGAHPDRVRWDHLPRARRRQAGSIAAKRLGRPGDSGAAQAFLCGVQAGTSPVNLHLDCGGYVGLVSDGERRAVAGRLKCSTAADPPGSAMFVAA